MVAARLRAEGHRGVRSSGLFATRLRGADTPLDEGSARPFARRASVARTLAFSGPAAARHYGTARVEIEDLHCEPGSGRVGCNALLAAARLLSELIVVVPTRSSSPKPMSTSS